MRMPRRGIAHIDRVAALEAHLVMETVHAAAGPIQVPADPTAAIAAGPIRAVAVVEHIQDVTAVEHIQAEAAAAPIGAIPPEGPIVEAAVATGALVHPGAGVDPTEAQEAPREAQEALSEVPEVLRVPREVSAVAAEEAGPRAASGVVAAAAGLLVVEDPVADAAEDVADADKSEPSPFHNSIKTSL